MIELDEARARIARSCSPLGAERVPLRAALGRVLAEPARTDGPVPPFDSSSMDGFAVRSADVAAASAGAPAALRLAGESAAGRPAGAPLGAGEAMAVSTGAAIPAGADAVVPLERSVRRNGRIELREPVEPECFVRRAGEDARAGATVIERGTAIGPAELGALASIGMAEVPCSRRPRLAVLTTGEELRAPGEPLGPGQIHDASGITIPAQAALAGAEITSVERLGDDPEGTEEALRRTREWDLTVVCGGVSVGEHDHVRPALERAGAQELFWGVALRPGKPTWFGTFPGGGLAFGLPGNPVSAMVTFHVFVRDAILRMLGVRHARWPSTAVIESDVPAVEGRAHLARCRLEAREDGWHAHPAPAQGSHLFSSMLGHDALAVLPSADSGARAGDRVAVEPLVPGLV